MADVDEVTIKKADPVPKDKKEEINIDIHDDDKNKIKITHIRQTSDWDCGLACVKMVLKSYNRDISSFDKVCNALNLKTSIWTIDLAYILQYYQLPCKYMTLTLGVDETYSSKVNGDVFGRQGWSFYKDHYQEDSQRVNEMFAKASEFGVPVIEKSADIKEIIGHLQTHRPIIILVDWSLIKWTSGIASNWNCLGGLLKRVTNYQGHYIVLNGVNSKKNCAYYHNPERSNESFSIHLDLLDQARKSHGTDEDVIFIMEMMT